MNVLGLDPLDQCGIHDADALAFPAGEADVDDASAPWQPDEVRMIHEIGLAANRVDGERLKRLCVQNFPHGLGVHWAESRRGLSLLQACQEFSGERAR